MPQWGVTRRNPVSTHEVVEHAFRARNDTVGKIGGGRLWKLPAAMRRLLHQGDGSSTAMVAPHLTAGGAGIVVLSLEK